PIKCVSDIARLEGVKAATPFTWYGGKYQDEIMPFAQFGVDPETVFVIIDEFTVPATELKAFKETRDSCVIGRKLAIDKKLKVGVYMPLKGDAYPIDLNLKIAGIYDGPGDRDLRMCLFNWEFFDEGMKRFATQRSSGAAGGMSATRFSGNAGMIFTKCK